MEMLGYEQVSRLGPPQISHLLPEQYILQLVAVEATDPASKAVTGYELKCSSTATCLESFVLTISTVALKHC